MDIVEDIVRNRCFVETMDEESNWFVGGQLIELIRQISREEKRLLWAETPKVSPLDTQERLARLKRQMQLSAERAMDVRTQRLREAVARNSAWRRDGAEAFVVAVLSNPHPPGFVDARADIDAKHFGLCAFCRDRQVPKSRRCRASTCTRCVYHPECAAYLIARAGSPRDRVDAVLSGRVMVVPDLVCITRAFGTAPNGTKPYCGNRKRLLSNSLVVWEE